MFRFPDYVQLHECPTRVIVNLVREAFRLLRPGGTLALTDFSVYNTIIKIFPIFFFGFMLLSQMLILIFLPSAAEVKGPSGIVLSCFLLYCFV